ncbi:hypothetical protein M8C21_025663 [Ambrosia artemisiifolia]|uniref:Myb-like domain-containing protein n=1 Tax=Ambrosia artemisiifolia TaxID=4212 RepID=A0AAD5GWV2_AMBAR|nr:hypothetical protein M8C21_025663 [Ambrosia artemisiifolia]
MDKQYAKKTHATTNAVPKRSPAGVSGRNHSVYWTPHEQSIMNKFLTKKASPNLVKRYAKIVLELQGKKTLYDVALRYRWMTKKAAYQQVKPSANAQSSTSMDGQECIDDEISYEANVGAASQLRERNDQAMNHISANGSAIKEKAAYHQVKPTSNHSNGLHDAQLSTSIFSYEEDIDDKISYKVIDGPTGKLVEQFEQAINQISGVKSVFKDHRNKNLISQMVNNMDVLMKVSLNDVPEMEPSARQRYDFSIMRRLKIV